MKLPNTKEKFRFHLLPSGGQFKFEHFLLSAVLIASVFVGIGQLPATYYAYEAHLFNLTDSSLFIHELGLYLGKNKLLVVLMIPFVLCIAALFFAFKFIHKTPSLPFFTARSYFDWKRLLLSFALWGGCTLVLFLASVDHNASFVWNYDSSTFWELLLIAVLLVPIQITCEELLFRSYVFKGLSFLKRPILQVFICGTLFGLMHAGNPEVAKLGNWIIVFYIWTGIFLGLVTHFDNGIELSIGYHAANNLFAIVVVTTNWQALQTNALWVDTRPPAMDGDLLWTLFVFQPLLFLFFKWKYKWGR